MGDIGCAQQLFREGSAGIVGRAGDGGVVARGQHGLGQLVAAQSPELRVARQEAMQEGRAGPVDAHYEDRLHDLLPLDLGMQPALAGERRIAAERAGQAVDHVAEPPFQQARIGR